MPMPIRRSGRIKVRQYRDNKGADKGLSSKRTDRAGRGARNRTGQESWNQKGRRMCLPVVFSDNRLCSLFRISFTHILLHLLSMVLNRGRYESTSAFNFFLNIYNFEVNQAPCSSIQLECLGPC